MKLDKRKSYYLVVDVETANGLGDPLVYDIGLSVMDKKGTIYREKSYVISDIFWEEKTIFNNPNLMNSAFYADKLPQYYAGLYPKNGADQTWESKSLMYVRKVIENWCTDFDIKEVCAYNANFDINALNTTIRYVTKSKEREFFPSHLEVIDIWNFACNTICTRVGYMRFCYDNQLYSMADNMQTRAETVYAYLTGNPKYEEKHTGLEDVRIECQILARCFRIPTKTEHRRIGGCPWQIPQEEFKRRFIVNAISSGATP